MEKEPKQAGEAKEQVQEEVKEPSKPASEETSTVKEKASEKVKIEDTAEYRNIQSLKDKADARAIKAEKAVESMQNQLQELHNTMERQRLDDQRRQIDALADDPEAQKKLIAKFDLDEEKRKFEDHMKEERQGIQVAWHQAADLVAEFELSPADVPELVNIKDAAHMRDRAELIARRKGNIIVEKEEKETPKETESGEDFTPDSGKSDAGGESDEEFLKSYSEGKSNDHARAQKILAKNK